MWTKAERVADSKISGYVWRRPKVNRDGWSLVDLTLLTLILKLLFSFVVSICFQ